MTVRFLILLLLAALLFSRPALAVEAVPGNACGTAPLITNVWQMAGGPENSGVVNGMFCNGSTWTGVINFQSTGNVGIGTTTPGARLDVSYAGSFSGAGGLLIESTGASDPSALVTIQSTTGSEYLALAGSGGTHQQMIVGQTGGLAFIGNSNVNGGDAIYVMNYSPYSIGNVGVFNATPGTALDVGGGFTTDPAATVSLTADNQIVTVGNSSYIRLSSNNTTSTNRTFCLTAGVAGQRLILEVILNNAELLNNSTICGGASVASLIAGSTWSPNANDTMELIYNGTNWLQIDRAAN